VAGDLPGHPGRYLALAPEPGRPQVGLHQSASARTAVHRDLGQGADRPDGAREPYSWGYRRIHGELLVLGIKTAASTVWEILQQAGIDPAPERTTATWADFLRSQASALLACDFFETVTLTGTRLHVLAVIEHATRRIRILGALCLPKILSAQVGVAIWFRRGPDELVARRRSARCSMMDGCAAATGLVLAENLIRAGESGCTYIS
jgi:hypothetical protein